MSWFKGKDDDRYTALLNAGERATEKGDHKKSREYEEKAYQLSQDGDVSKARQNFWW